jgi:hypothetical protein
VIFRTNRLSPLSLPTVAGHREDVILLFRTNCLSPLSLPTVARIHSAELRAQADETAGNGR